MFTCNSLFETYFENAKHFVRVFHHRMTFRRECFESTHFMAKQNNDKA